MHPGMAVLLADPVPGAGFRIEAEEHVKPLLYCVRAGRPE